ncbi:hypothetical protein [Methylocella silvestris]|uniref:Uncharacterized protein n=1 Tax=Methylocella silvestris TaxID=199596 RepID=A0A2J7TCF3_METSI|nr:hypothetical protein [Methylocella silvestris]PNG24454.1 hypothetical protein CR492_18715 [Methylocella silvestris]
MYILSVAALVFGIVLGCNFKAYILAPSCAVVALVTVMAATFAGERFFHAALYAALFLTLLQIGYLLGVIGWSTAMKLHRRRSGPALPYPNKPAV